KPQNPRVRGNARRRSPHAEQGIAKVGGAAETARRVARQRTQYKSVHGWRECNESRGRSRVRSEATRNDLGGCRATGRLLSCEHLMQHHTERIDIRALVDDIAAHLLRRQILRRPKK